MTLVIRNAILADAQSIADIYAFHVLKGTASFDTVPRTLAQTQERISMIAGRRWPFLVAEKSGRVVGYAYATQFRDREAYAYSCENSIYVATEQRGTGVGSALLKELVIQAERCGFRQMIAVVGGGEPGSIAVHARAGFDHAGRMKSVGRKMGKWLDTVYMQRSLGTGDMTAPGRDP